MKKLVVANWKMNPLSLKEAEKIFALVLKRLPRLKNVQVVVCPPSIYIEELREIGRKVSLGAQNVFWEETGPYTGEISAQMLYDFGARFTIVGHSERRALGETDADINKKIKSAVNASLTPILCVGETIRDDKHEYFDFVKNQIITSLGGLPKRIISDLIIAYEPVWAISTTSGQKDATAQDSFEMITFIKKVLSDKFGLRGEMPRFLYGGSVSERNVDEFLSFGGADGVLIGKASLDPDRFSAIVKIVSDRK